MAKDAFSFAQNRDPFTDTFPDWFRISPNNTNQLDTDIVLAFPSLDTIAHPHFDKYTKKFASSNVRFLNKFFAAMHKMGQLGVKIALFPSTDCQPRCTRVAGDGGDETVDGGGGEIGERFFPFWQNYSIVIILTMSYIFTVVLPQ